MSKVTRVICPYCGQPAVYRQSSASLYRGNDFGPVWYCDPCEAWVGCHNDTDRPLGRLANAELRRAKIEAHAAFDRLWKGKMRRDGCSKNRARAAGYKWLAAQLGIAPRDCHIGMFDVDQCRRVVEVCKQPQRRAA